jgi:acetyl esterase/lipase
MRTSSDASQIKRRTFLKYKATVGMIGVLGAWGISRTKIMWQVNKIMALASLGGKAEQANTTPFSGTELAVAFSNNLQQYALVFSPVATAPCRRSRVFFGNGGWNMGNPDRYQFIGRFFAPQGFPTILAGYRLTPEYQFPAQLEDMVTSLRAGMDFL